MILIMAQRYEEFTTWPNLGTRKSRHRRDYLFQVGILVNDVLDAGTILLRIQIVMTYDHGAGVTRVQFLKQSSHGCLLRLSARVGGLTADVIPALVADADRVGIVVLAVGTC